MSLLLLGLDYQKMSPKHELIAGVVVSSSGQLYQVYIYKYSI